MRDIKGKFTKGHKVIGGFKQGHRQSVESRYKMSLAKKGKPSNRKGVKLTKEHCKNLSISHLGKMTKEQHWNWKGGITPMYLQLRRGEQYKFWRKSVFQRDNFTCQKYGTKGGKLHSHHINNFADFSELRFAIDNGITLSEKAHDEFHKKYGYRNNTREQLEEFLGI